MPMLMPAPRHVLIRTLMLMPMLMPLFMLMLMPMLMPVFMLMLCFARQLIVCGQLKKTTFVWVKRVWASENGVP